MNKKAWLTGPALFVLCVAVLFVTWAAMEPSPMYFRLEVTPPSTPRNI